MPLPLRVGAPSLRRADRQPLAGLFQKSDPALAANLAWGVQASKNDLGGHADSAFKLYDVGLAAVQPARS